MGLLIGVTVTAAGLEAAESDGAKERADCDEPNGAWEVSISVLSEESHPENGEPEADHRNAKHQSAEGCNALRQAWRACAPGCCVVQWQRFRFHLGHWLLLFGVMLIPGGEDFGFFLCGEACAPFVIGLEGSGESEGGGGGIGEGAELEADGSGFCAVDFGEAGVVAFGGDPEGHLHPRADTLGEEEWGIDPDELGIGGGGCFDAVEKLGHGHGMCGADGVVGAAVALFEAGDDEVGEVADVDVLDGGGGISGGENAAAVAGGLINAVGPVGESVGVVSGADDEGGADVGGAVAEELGGGLFAEGFEGAVSFAGDFFGVGTFGKRGDGVGLVDADLGEAVINADGGDEDVLADVALEHFAGASDLPVGVAGGIYDRVELPTGEGGNVAVAVAVELFEIGEEVGVGFAAVEEDGGVFAGEERFDDSGAEKAGAAEDEYVHGVALWVELYAVCELGRVSV